MIPSSGAHTDFALEDAPARALSALETLLATQRKALVSGDLNAIRSSQASIHALLVNPGWQREAAKLRSKDRLREAMQSLALNAQLAARGESAALRGLNAMSGTPALYGAGGSMLKGPGGFQRTGRGLSA